MAENPRLRVCLLAFKGRRYADAAREAMAILAEGANLPVVQLLLISLQRWERDDLLAQAAHQALASCAENPWELALVELTLGRVEGSAVLALASNSRQRIQAHCYAGSHLLTSGRLVEARREFDACRKINLETFEQYLAGVQRKETFAPEVKECIRAFVDGHYATCAAARDTLLDNGLDHEVLQLVLIAIQRSGQTQCLEAAATVALSEMSGEPWFTSLLRVTLGHIDGNELLTSTMNSTSRCQVHFYVGARAATRGQFQKAVHEFDLCLATAFDCFECKVARIERDRALRQA